MNFNYVPLSELCAIHYGKDHKKLSNGRYPVYGSGGIIRYVDHFLYDKPSVLIPRKGTLSNLFYVDNPFWTVDTIFWTEINEEKVNPKFLYYFLLTKNLEELNIGSAVPSLSTEVLNKIVISLPPVSIQNKIVSTLSTFDSKIESNNKINDNLSKQITNYFIHLFIDNEDSTNWETNNIGSLVEDTLGGDWGKDSPIGNNTEMVYCIRGADIPDVKFGNKGKMPIRYILPKNYAAKKLHNGDLVVEISGGSPTQSTGRVAYISESLLKRFDKGLVCTNFCRAVKPKTGWSMFLYILWQYLYDKDLFFIYENGTTGIKNFDLTGFLEKEKVSIPPAKLLEQFNQLCTASFDMIFKNGLENEKLANMRDSLLPKLMTGEIDVDSIEL